MRKPMLAIRAYRPGDLDAVIAIFQGAISQTAARDYASAELTAWAQVDRESWAVRRLSRPTWVAVADGPVGFIDLEPDGHLDMLYVHPAHNGLGIATALLDGVEAAARGQGLSRIFTEASVTARPFFERRGFRLLAVQTVELRGQRLANFRMDKLLA